MCVCVCVCARCLQGTKKGYTKSCDISAGSMLIFHGFNLQISVKCSLSRVISFFCSLYAKLAILRGAAYKEKSYSVDDSKLLKVQ